MNVYLNENVRRLRKEKGITQETLADFLGVSFQSVSKWERGETLPDITLVPAIANYFGVTIDELMGNDKIINEDRINEYLGEYARLYNLDTKQSVSSKNLLAREAYKKYPYDWRIIDMYRNSLTNGHEGTIADTRPETRRICELILESCTIENYRTAAVSDLLYIAETLEEAEIWLNHLPNDITLRQNELRVDTYVRFGKYDEARLQQKMNLYEHYTNLIQTMTDMCDSWQGMPKPATEFIIAMEQKKAAVTNIFFESGEFFTHSLSK